MSSISDPRELSRSASEIPTAPDAGSVIAAEVTTPTVRIRHTTRPQQLQSQQQQGSAGRESSVVSSNSGHGNSGNDEKEEAKKKKAQQKHEQLQEQQHILVSPQQRQRKKVKDEDPEKEDLHLPLDTQEKDKSKIVKVDKEKSFLGGEGGSFSFKSMKGYCFKGFHAARNSPPRHKYLFLMFWIANKLLMAFLVAYLIKRSTLNRKSSSSSMQSHLLPPSIRILYIVTSLAEYNRGRIHLKRNQDRLAEYVLPIMVDGVESILSMSSPHRFEVDVYLILFYKLRPHREQMIRSRLPESVGLEIWDDACQLAYENVTNHLPILKQRLKNLRRKHGSKENFNATLADVLDPAILDHHKRSLSRQHRFVVKDKLPYYDLFMAFEDDMRITGHHVEHYVQMSRELEQLRKQYAILPDERFPTEPEPMDDPKRERFFGTLSKRQLSRLVPGFIRVEVLLNESAFGPQKEHHLDPIPIDHTFETATESMLGHHKDHLKMWMEERHFDPKYCCHVPNMVPNIDTPPHPRSQDVIVWETGIKALSVRQLPPLPLGHVNHASNETSSLISSPLIDWVVMMPGPSIPMPAEDKFGGYWSGRDGEYGDEEKPSPVQGEFFAQQGGWMGTRQQILRWNGIKTRAEKGIVHSCKGSFLPPFDPPVFFKDGLNDMTVEFWSGGFQLFAGRQGCNMQRVLTLKDPDDFAKHFLYHVTNNKQRQLSDKHHRFVRADHLLGQVNTVLKRAKREKEKLVNAGDEGQGGRVNRTRAMVKRTKREKKNFANAGVEGQGKSSKRKKVVMTIVLK